ncbi:MAG: DUF4350 domain-containing protein [Actinomycetes bacterium]
MNGRRSIVVVLVAVVVAVFFIASGVTGRAAELPYAVNSTTPSGLGAFAALVRQRGVQVVEADADRVAAAQLGTGDALLVPVPSFAADGELRAFSDAARRGARVVLGSPETDAAEFFEPPSRYELITEPANTTGRGVCDIDALRSFGSIDVRFGQPFEPSTAAASCYRSTDGAYVAEERRGLGSIATLGGSELLVNARLWPDKEHGGRVLDNAAVGLALLGVGAPDAPRRLWVVTARPSPVAAASGRQTLTDLLPVGVQLALVQLLLAVGVYSWWRGRRFGEPVRDIVPVAVSGAELTVAIGDLYRRRADAETAAAALRADARRVLCERLGVPVAASVDALAAVLSARTGVGPDTCTSLLADPPHGRPVSSTHDVVQLAHDIDQLRSEVLNEQSI